MEYEVLYVSNNIKTVENKERNSDFNTIVNYYFYILLHYI